MRYRERLNAAYRAVGRVTASILILLGFIHLVPLLVLLPFPHESAAATAFIIPAVTGIILGLILWVLFRRADVTILTLRDGVLITFLVWTIACCLGAVPYNLQGLGWRNALFESVSGWSTTGLTVVDVTRASPLILFWRAFQQLLGGAGLILVMSSALAGPWATGLYQAEGHGEPLLPHIGRSTRAILGIYLGYTLLGVGAFLIAGLPLFESILHSMTALATGGFSTQPGSLGDFHSISVEGVAIVLMALGQLNFLLHFLILRGKWRTVLKHGEPRLFIGALLIAVPLLYFGAARSLWGMEWGIRRALFQAVSALSGTGFSIAPDAEWNSLGAAVIIGLMLIGGGVNSSAGALKQHRVYLILKSMVWQIRRFFLPRSAVFVRQIWKGEERVVLEAEHLQGVAGYVILYLFAWSMGSIILMGYGTGMQAALFEFASALGGVGLTVGVTRPDAPGGILWTEMIGMFLGRLEFFVVILALGKMIIDFREFARFGINPKAPPKLAQED